MTEPLRWKYQKTWLRFEPEQLTVGVKPDAALSAAVIWDSVCVTDELGVMPCDDRKSYVGTVCGAAVRRNGTASGGAARTLNSFTAVLKNATAWNHA